MVRTALLLFLLGTLVATAAHAARIVPVRTRAHAPLSKTPVRKSHGPLHRTTSGVSHSRSRAGHNSAAIHTNRTTARRSTKIPTSSLHTRYVARHGTTLRRARYYRYPARAHFVPLANVPVATHQIHERNETGDQADDSPEAAQPSPAYDTDQSSSPRAASPSAVQAYTPRETDTLPAPGTDPSVMASAGNPLASPRNARQPIVNSSGPIAELTRPPIFTGRVSSYSLRGTHDSLVRQNERSEEENLERIENDTDLQDRISRGLLVRVPESVGLAVNPALPENRRYCRPWTAEFLANLAHAHHTQFHTPLIVSSAVRTVEYQARLMRINGNAADAEGDIVSPHLTGGTVDIAKSGLPRRELEWMRRELLAYQNAGVIDVEEEFHQRCFHITVYKNYGAHTHPASEPDRTATTPAPDSPSAISIDSTTPDNQ
jgi:hypothetical protein